MEALRDLAARAISSPEQIIFFGLFLAFVGFAVYWVYLIMG